jgi:hypothetical protein
LAIWSRFFFRKAALFSALSFMCAISSFSQISDDDSYVSDISDNLSLDNLSNDLDNERQTLGKCCIKGSQKPARARVRVRVCVCVCVCVCVYMISHVHVHVPGVNLGCHSWVSVFDTGSHADTWACHLV